MPSPSHQLDDDVRGLEDLNAFRWELVTHTEGTREAVLRIPVDVISQSGDMLSKFGNHDRRQPASCGNSLVAEIEETNVSSNQTADVRKSMAIFHNSTVD